MSPELPPQDFSGLRVGPLRIGVDFDNTIICYDQAFAAQAQARQLLPPGLAPTKLAIRDHLRAVGREDEWTRLQGEVYGPGILAAEPYAGVAEFFAACAKAGVFVRVISHKTARPYLGEPHDLHAWARSWLAARGFFDGSGLTLEQVEFWPTKAEKAGRIRELGLTHFIDDLPEFLAELDWPGLTRILFDPNCAHCVDARVVAGRFACAASWAEVAGRLLGAEAESK